jgi:hypothetical protein
VPGTAVTTLQTAADVSGDGVYGEGVNGVHGVAGGQSGTAPNLGCGVFGESENGYGVYGASKTASGVYGTSPSGHFAGEFDGDVRITGDVTAKAIALSGAVTAAGVNTGDLTITGSATGGSMTLTGNLTAADVILSGADCAEEFDVNESDGIEPGSVVVFDGNGVLDTSETSYDKRVAGVISGAGCFRPGVVLDRRISDRRRLPVALIGKVYCKVDASYAAIEVGDFLTTSPTRGHAMKVTTGSEAFGSVIGKALAPFSGGCGLIPVLVSLQ